MSLTEEQKNKIEEEEAYRSQLRVKPEKKKGIGCLGITLILMGIGIFSSIVISAINPAGQIERAKQVSQKSVNPVFDVPALIGKNLDGVIATLGSPEKDEEPTKLQIDMGVKEWAKSFKKDGQVLLVTYTISNRKIVDFFIGTDDPSGKTKDTSHLLALGNLKTNDLKYKIEFVKSISNSTYFTGVKIIPK